jgi:ankyrin repeat protein
MPLDNEMFLSAANGDMKVVKRLLKDNIRYWEHTNSNGFTPIHIAAECGNINVLKAFVRKGARKHDLNKCTENDRQMTAIALATTTDRIDTVAYLNDQGADASIKDVKGFTPIHLSIMYHSNPKMVKLLFKAHRPEQSLILRILTLIIIHKNTDMLHALVECGVSVDTLLDGGRSLLMICADKAGKDFYSQNSSSSTHLDMMKYLIRNGARMSTQDDAGFTALHYAAMRGPFESVRLLTVNQQKQKIDFTRKTCDIGQTALHVVVLCGDESWAEDEHIIPWLISVGFEPNATTCEGKTPLHYAARTKGWLKIDQLLHAGAAAYARDLYSHIPLYYAVKTDERSRSGGINHDPSARHELQRFMYRKKKLRSRFSHNAEDYPSLFLDDPSLMIYTESKAFQKLADKALTGGVDPDIEVHSENSVDPDIEIDSDSSVDSDIEL